jgi:hypothetical protein
MHDARTRTPRHASPRARTRAPQLGAGPPRARPCRRHARPPTVRAQANAERVAQLEKHRGRCQPVFLLFRDGRQVDAVEGVDGPRLRAAVAAHAPPKRP